MDRRYSSSSSSTAATETAKKPSMGNALNSSMRLRNGLSSADSTTGPSSHRKSFPSTSDVGSSFNSTIQHDDQFNSQYGLTQAGLEEYSRSYYEQNMMYNHQKQSSYAQSEGYHSYVSSADSTSTPFLDRLRQDSQLLQSRAINWSQDFQTPNLNGSSNSISSSTSNINNDCSESNSSTETLKWLGSMSDVSVVSQATNTSTLSASSQLIVHSSKVRTPQRHNSESVLYMNDEGKMNGTNSTEDLSSEQFQHRSSRSDNRLFPINTYTEQTPISLSASTTSLDAKLPNNHNWQSVADRINELEKQQHKQQQAIHDHNKQHYTYLDPSKTHRVPNPTLKAFQKNAIQSYFERQQQQQQSIRLSRNHHGNSGGSKSDELTKMKSIGGSEMSKSNGNIAPRPQSLNLSIATSAISLPTTPSSAVSSASSSAGSQRSSISAWPNVSPTTNPSIMIGSKASDGMMMKNANDIAKMNMKNSAMSSAAALSEKQLFAGSKGNNSKSQSISKNLFTSFCEIKTENYPSSKAHEGIAADNNGANKTNSTPPPLPRKSSVLRRTSSASEYSSVRDKMLQQNQHLSKDLLGAMIIGQIISIDDWVPDRPPKNPSLRIPSPELPPPPNVENIPALNQDDPLPPPPPELLKSTDLEVKMNPTSRRNSFAGQSSSQQTKVKANNIPLSPPAIPMRPKIVPTPIMTVNPVKNICQMPQEQTVHAQRVIVPKSDDHLQFNGTQQPQQMSPPHSASGRASDSRVSVRKRAHNSKDCIGYTPAQQQSTPPPLKPRMRNQNEISNNNGHSSPSQNVFTPIVNKVRSNSKASYLPRQQREKLLDPDHGSYKLTLHELNDNIKEGFQEEISKCNLPDVLPVTVKYHNSYRHTHHHHRQPPHHLSQHFTPQPHYHPTETHLTPQTAPVLSSNALKSIFQFAMGNSGSSTPVSNSSSSASSSPLIPSSPFNGSTKSPLSTPPASLQSPKYTSQSTIDLKMTQVIDPKLYTNDELIKTYHQQKEACRELNKTILNNSLQATSVNECDNKIAVVRKLNMVESPDASPKNSVESLIDKKTTSTESLKSLEEKATSEKSEKDIKTENAAKRDEEVKVKVAATSPALSDTDDALKTTVTATVQKTEIVLRVHPIMQETACQTDETSEVHENIVIASNGDLEKPSKVNLWNTPTKRQKHPEELDFENLSKDLASQLSPSDKLHSILVPKTIKSSSDYISDLFKINITSRPTKKDVSTSTLEKSAIKSSMEVLTSNSTYFSISEPKAKLMTRYSREMTLINSDSSDLTKKKEELVERLGKKLKVLETEQTMLAEESSANESLGHDVAFKVAQKVRPGDSTKFRTYVDDVGYITMLLLSLSGRLARTENALHTIGDKTSADKKILETKRDRLLEQLDEAKHLKEDIDRRGTNLSKVLEKFLTDEEYADYDYFINTKAKLIVDSREIADKIKLGEEQLNALKDTLVHSEC